MSNANEPPVMHSARVFASTAADGLGVTGRSLRAIRAIAETVGDGDTALEAVAIGELIDEAATRMARLRERLAE